jgi:hypothetical protein
MRPNAAVRALRAAVAAMAVAALPAVARAQASSFVTAGADISSTLLSIGTQRNLVFGVVVPGTPTVIDPRTNANAGMFAIHGNRNAEVAVTFTLPTQLVVGPWTMPITFGPNSGCWRTTSVQGGCTRYDPSTVLVQRIRNQNPPNNQLYVWIGGTASPSPTQHSGIYAGTITLSVVYTGN